MATNSHIQPSKNLQATLKSIEVEQYLAEDMRRRKVRYITGMMSSVVAAVYFLIGANLLVVFESGDSQFFGFFAGVAYAFGALVLFAVQSRSLWVAGAIFQLFVIYTYFSLAPQRIPEFEIWGMVIGVLQALILIGLAYLITRAPSPVDT